MSSSCSLFPANFRVKDTRLALISTSGAAGKQISSRRQASLANNRGYAGLETLIYQERLIRAMSGTPNLATQPVARETSTFGGTSTEELAYWLSTRGVDCSEYGQNGAKSLQELLTEVQKGESVLIHRDGAVERELEVLSIIVVTDDFERVLVEDRQVRPDGAVRHREMLLSEKLIPGETWRDAVDRAIAEELGSALEGPRAQYELFPETYSQGRNVRVSTSYPGLKTISTLHTVAAGVHNIPQNRDFTTFERRPGGILESHWRWAGKEWREQARTVLEALKGRHAPKSS